MASNALTMFDPKAGVPAHIAGFFDEESNITGKLTVPSLSPEGKIWTVALNGEKTKLLRKNADGDEEPVSVMRVVILNFAQRRGRSYYEGTYDAAKISAPICWSDDGITPDDSLPGPFPPGDPKLADLTSYKVSSRCDTCPMSVKGSKANDQGKALAACGQHRMLVVVPAFNLDFQPLRLKIAMTSDFDKQSPDAAAQNWFAFSNYLDFLKSRGVQHTAAVVTKMKFDPNQPYPKIFFSPERYLEPDELAKITPLTKDPEVAKLLGGTWTPAGVDGVKKVEAAAQPEPEPEVPAATEVQATAKYEPDDDDGEIIMAGINAPAADQAQSIAQGDEPVIAASPKKEPAKAAKAAAEVAPEVSNKVPEGVADLLRDWGAD